MKQHLNTEDVCKKTSNLWKKNWIDNYNEINVFPSCCKRSLEWWGTYVSYTMVESKPRGFSLSPAKMNGRVFIHSGVKLLLYLADRRGLMYSLRPYFLSLCTALASASSPYHTWCSGFTAATLVITKDLWGCLCAGMCSNAETWPQTALMDLPKWP